MIQLEFLKDLPKDKYTMYSGELPDGVQADFCYINKTLEYPIYFVETLDKQEKCGIMRLQD